MEILNMLYLIYYKLTYLLDCVPNLVSGEGLC